MSAALGVSASRPTSGTPGTTQHPRSQGISNLTVLDYLDSLMWHFERGYGGARDYLAIMTGGSYPHYHREACGSPTAGPTGTSAGSSVTSRSTPSGGSVPCMRT